MGKEPSLRVQASSFSHPKANLLARLQRHPFVCGMSLLLPVFPREGDGEGDGEGEGRATTEAVVREAAARLEPLCGRFFSVTSPLYAFLDSEFLDQHVRAPAAEFFLLSKSNPADDRQDIAAITPTGLLQMAVSKATFRQLGIPGKRSTATPGDMYHISIDLRAQSFRHGKPLHDRVVLCLQRNPFPLHFTCCFVKDGRSMRPSFPSPVTQVEAVPLTPSHWSAAADLPTRAFFQALAHTVTPCHTSQNTTVAACLHTSAAAEAASGSQNAQAAPGSLHRDASGLSAMEGTSAEPMEEGVGRGPKEGVREGLHEGGREGPEEGVREGLHEGGREGPEEGVREGLHEGGREGPEEGRGEAMEEDGGGECQEGGSHRFASASAPRDASALLGLFHWLGLMCCDLPLLQGHLRTATQELREAVGIPAGSSESVWSGGEIQRLNLKGPLTPLQLLGALRAAQELTGTGVLPWCALATWGFPGTPEDCIDSRRPFKAGHGSADSCFVVCGEDRFLHFLCE